jgi:hypothetical protein
MNKSIHESMIQTREHEIRLLKAYITELVKLNQDLKAKKSLLEYKIECSKYGLKL